MPAVYRHRRHKVKVFKPRAYTGSAKVASIYASLIVHSDIK